jgi:hypothetical protein
MAMAHAKGETARERIDFLVEQGIIGPADAEAFQIYGNGMDKLLNDITSRRTQTLALEEA